MGRNRRRSSVTALLLLALSVLPVCTFGCGSVADSAVSLFTITAGTDGRGFVSPSGAVRVAAGSARTFRFTPGTACHLAEVVVDGTSAGAVAAYTFENITGDHTIVATFSMDAGVTAVAACDSPYPGDAGYVCNGVDDQVEIQEAIASLGGSPGRVVLLPGTYRISRTILVDHCLTLEGWGHDTVLRLESNSNCSVIGDPGGYGDPRDNVTIRSLRIDGNKAGQARGHGILRTGAGATYENLWVEDCAGRGISQTSGSCVRVAGCSVRDCTGRGIFLERCSLSEVSGNRVCGCGLLLNTVEEKAIEVYGGGDCRIIGNYVEGGGAMRQIGAWDSPRVEIARNTLVNGLAMGIAPRSPSARITGNTVINAGNNAIDICAADDNWIEGNAVRRVARVPLGPANIENSGICLNGSRSTVIDNYVEFCGRAGIHIGPLHNDNRVINNVIRNCGQQGCGAAGIWVQVWTAGAVTSGTIIRGNTVYDDQAVKTQAYGIWLDPGNGHIDDTVIQGNDLRHNGTAGISPYSITKVRNATIEDNLL